MREAHMDSPTSPSTEREPERTQEPATLPDVETSASSTAGDFVMPDSETAPQAPRPPRQKIRIETLGDYRLGEKIGAGAMGAVYRARQISKDRPAAIKVLKRRLASDPLYLQRFLREGQVMAQLSHPNIVRCYKLGMQYGRYYIAMELVEGRSLGEWLLSLRRLSVGDALHITLACARALQHAHQNGLIHRDVKPDNLLITHSGEVKLADLGLAFAVLNEDVSATETGHGAGTPVYVAPEQARDARDADPRSDLYSLGCMLYQMLAGSLPFNGERPLDIVMKKVKGEFTLLSERFPDLPEALDDLVARLLSPHPDDRCQSATDLIAQLEKMKLVSPSLSFIGSVTEPPAVSAAPGATDGDLDYTEADSTLRPGKRWYIQSRTPGGEWETRRLTTEQVLEGLDDEQFARTAQASLYRGGYRRLLEITEFRGHLLLRRPEMLEEETVLGESGDEDAEAGETEGPSATGQSERGGQTNLLLLVMLALGLGLLYFLMR
jgi:serine/threonine-protein kinase